MIKMYIKEHNPPHFKVLRLKKSSPSGRSMLKVKKVEYAGEYKLKILFSNGISKVVDFESWVSEENVYLKPLRNIEYFKKVTIDDSNYSICWPNGADFCPDVLFEVGQEITKRRKTSFSKKPQKSRNLRKSRLSKKT